MDIFFQTPWVKRLYTRWPFKDYEDQLKSLDLHELIQEDLCESVTQDKIDDYEDTIFLVLHFPKYNQQRQQYISNEFDIILRRDELITLSRFKSNHMEKIRDDYQSILDDAERDEIYKFSSYYILYRVIDTMYDKILRGLGEFAKDLTHIEDQIFSSQSASVGLLEQIMIKRRNGIQLKHMIAPHRDIIEELQEWTLKLFGGELDVYFEDLSFKIDKIASQIIIQNENIDSMYDIYSSMVSMKTNQAVTTLTIFTAVIGVMTLITGRYGMNIPLRWQENPLMPRVILGAVACVGVVLLAYFRTKKRR